ncbi:MAG: M48 family metallopeptidase [Candidatus Nitrosopolaris sp.]
MSIKEFKERVDYWANKTGIFPNRVHVHPMTNKWASWSTSGILSFNTDLLAEKKEFCEYVIVHELLHLQIPNHGKLFNALLSTYTQDNKVIKKSRSVCGIK